MSDSPTVYEALAEARRQIGGVGKHQQNEAPGAKYNFRGIDAVVNAAAPVLAQHGINIVPTRIVESSSGQIVYGSKNNKSQTARLVIEYTVIGPAGDSFTIQAIGEAFDSGDKATPKAHSVAWRTALIQALMLPTDETDPDAFTYDGNTGEVQDVNWASEAYQLTGGNVRKVKEVFAALQSDYATGDDLPPADAEIWERVVVWLNNERNGVKQ